jgi:WD40 repeat protein
LPQAPPAAAPAAAAPPPSSGSSSAAPAAPHANDNDNDGGGAPLGHAPASTVTALAALPRGALASAGSDGAVCIWARTATKSSSGGADPDAATPTTPTTPAAAGTAFAFTCTQELRGHTSEVRALALLRCGALLSGAWDATLRLWRAPPADDNNADAAHSSDPAAPPPPPPRPFACAGVWRGHNGPVWALCALPDGGAASGSEDTTVRLWPPPPSASQSVHVPRLMLRGHTEDVDALCVLSCGLRLASGSIDATVRLWRLSDGACEALLCGHGDCVTALAPLRGDANGHGNGGGIGGIGFGVASASADRSVRVWRAPLAGAPPPPELQPPSLLLPGDIASASAQAGSAQSEAQRPQGALALPRPEDLLCLLGPFRALLPRPRGGAGGAPGAAGGPGGLLGCSKAAATLQAHAQPVAALVSLPDGRLVSGGADAALCVWGRAPAANPLICALDPAAAAWRCERVLQSTDGPAAARPVTAIVTLLEGAADALPRPQSRPQSPRSPLGAAVCGGGGGSPRVGPPVRIAVAFGGRVRVWQLRGGAVEETFSATRPVGRPGDA